MEYDKMPDMWSIWILPYDPFGKDYMLYSVKNVVEDFPEIDYNDGVRKLFLYTDGKNGGSDALKKLLKYIRYSKEENAVDEELKKLHSNVKRIKSRKEIGVKYMHMQEIIKYTVEEAVEEAVKETAELTEQRMGKLIEILLAEKRYDDLQRMATDSEYRKKLLEEISEE